MNNQSCKERSSHKWGVSLCRCDCPWVPAWNSPFGSAIPQRCWKRERKQQSLEMSASFLDGSSDCHANQAARIKKWKFLLKPTAVLEDGRIPAAGGVGGAGEYSGS